MAGLPAAPLACAGDVDRPPAVVPNALRHTEWNLRALEGSGLGFSDRMYVNVLLFAFVRGIASASRPRRRRSATPG